MIGRILRSRWAWVAVSVSAVSTAHLLPFGALDLTPTIDLVEAEWSLTALVGVIYSIDFIRDCALDWRVAAAAGDQADRGSWLVVEMLLLVGILLLGLHLMLLAIGVLSAAAPTNPHPTSPVLAAILGVAFTVAGQQLVLVLVVIRAKRAEMRAL